VLKSHKTVFLPLLLRLPQGTFIEGYRLKKIRQKTTERNFFIEQGYCQVNTLGPVRPVA
jgi:hypothetical protein